MSLSLGQVETRRSWIDQVAQNAARQARVTLYVATTGAGEAKLTTTQLFGVGFLDLPSISSGYYCEGSQLVTGFFPNANSFVHEWVYNANQTLVIGAKIALVIDVGDGTNSTVAIRHHLTFIGEAVKLLPVGAT